MLKTTLTHLTQKLRLHPCVFTAIWLGLTLVRNATEYPDIIDDILPQLCIPICHQARLGWKQLYYGHLARVWAAAIDCLHPHMAQPGTQIMTMIINTIWKYILEIWKIRNEHLHHAAGQLDLPNYKQAAMTLYNLRQCLPTEAQDALYCKSLESILDLPPT